jgi:ABC-type transporter Mla subunit MlaD
MMDFEGAIAEIKNKDNAETFNKSVHSLQAIVDNLLAHGTYGLSALKALIDAIDDDLGNSSYGLAALETLVTAVEAKLDDGTTGLAAIRAILTALGTELTNGTYGLAALKALIDAVEAKLDDGTSGLDALKTLLDAIEAKLDNLAGETPVSGSVTGNWQSGTATSGETGADVITIGANDTKKKLHSLLLSIHNFTSGGKVTVKLFMQVNGTERKVYQEDFNKGNDPDGLWVVNGVVGIHEALRVEMQSNRAADNGVALDYDYMLEAM